MITRICPTRFHRTFVGLGLLIVAWCVMTLTHEAGHLIGGFCCGGTLVDADLWPWRLPYSVFSPDPHPLITLWAGPILGVIVPVVSACLVRREAVWFVAYFCMLANGAYLSAAWVSGDRYLDTTRLLEHGARPIVIALYCLVTVIVGYAGFRRSCIRLLGRQSVRQHADRANE